MKKNGKVLILEIIVILLAIIGITLALTFIMNSIGLNTTNVNLALDYTGSTTLPSVSLFPISDSSVSTNTDNVLKVNFSVKGASTNPSDKDIIYDVILDNLNLSCYLKNEYLKWRLIKNGTTLTEGNFSPTFDIMKDNKLYLTTIQQDLPASNATADSYQLLIWISEACSDLTSCSSNMDQRPMMGETISGNIQILLHTEGKKTLTRTTGTALNCDSIHDNSGANSPDLVQGLIPVKYDETNGWVKADSTNKKTSWYNYDDKRWANAVLVSDTNRATYQSAQEGTAIPESDVLAYYVWIPRYKYKVFNINKVIDTDSYNAKTTGIDIVFESGTQSTGTVSCNYNFAITDGSLSEICTGNNGDYYTHPAFTFGTTQVRGIWVGKFEISSETPDVQTNGNYYGGGNVTNLTVRVKPNVRSWRYNKVDNLYKVIYDMQTTNNIYGLSTNRSNTDSHMLKNIEWGAVAYLTNSKYGRCTNNTCTEVTINNSSNYITGNAGSTVSASSASGTTNAYNTTNGQLASTTGNIYGIYDMSGGAYEYVMGNMSSATGSYTFYASSAGSNYTYSGYEKYIDTYAYGSSYSNQTAYNRSRLGDATGGTRSWYSDNTTFVNSAGSWFLRGGYYSNTTIAGPFNFYSDNGSSNSNYSARLALLSTSS